MAIYHNSFQIIKRSEGRSVVTAAAYRAGENLVDHTTGLRHDERKKGRDHVIWSEILLPQNAPEEWRDRETFWNAVERSETGRNAQLAREFNAALPYECTRTEWIEIAREYGKWFTDQGMCVDLAIHTPDHKIPNPHIHGMLTMREVDKNGQFAKNKTRTVYRLDQNGEKIPMPAEGTPTRMIIDNNGDMVSVPDFERGGVQKTGQRGRREYYREKRRMNDWDSKEFLIAARKEWADVCNRHLDREHQIDHRSYKEQGIDKTPTTHDGVAARAIYQRMLSDKKYRYDRQTMDIPPHHFSYISRYTIDGRRRTEIEMILCNFLAVISLLLDNAQEDRSNRAPVLEQMKWDARTDIACMNEYGVTRKLEQRSEMYAACTVRELKNLIREKEHRLGELKKEIAEQMEAGRTATPEQRALREALKKAEQGQTISDKDLREMPREEKDRIMEAFGRYDSFELKYLLQNDRERLNEIAGEMDARQKDGSQISDDMRSEADRLVKEIRDLSAALLMHQQYEETERKRREQKEKRIHEKIMRMTKNGGWDYSVPVASSIEACFDENRRLILLPVDNLLCAKNLIQMMHAAMRESEPELASEISNLLTKYHHGESNMRNIMMKASMQCRWILENRGHEKVRNPDKTTVIPNKKREYPIFDR